MGGCSYSVQRHLGRHRTHSLLRAHVCRSSRCLRQLVITSRFSICRSIHKGAAHACTRWRSRLHRGGTSRCAAPLQHRRPRRPQLPTTLSTSLLATFLGAPITPLPAPPHPSWSASLIDVFGFSVVHANISHFHFQFTADGSGEVLDEFIFTTS